MKLLSLLLCLSTWPGSTEAPKPAVFHYENVLGTSLELKVRAANPDAELAAQAAVLGEIGRLSNILSGYDTASEFSRWRATRGETVTVSPELYDVLAGFDRYRKTTEGALDPAAEAATRLWKAGTPNAPELAETAAAIRRPHWTLDAANHTATHLDDTPLMLNSFAKSYIADRAATRAMELEGIDAVTLNIGGDVVTRGSRETISIADPFNDAENAAPAARIAVSGSTVATSGDYRRGKHLIDPRTAAPAEGVASSTVVSADPVEAGALATAFAVLKPADSVRIAATRPGVEYMLIASNGTRFTSPGWAGMALAPAAAPAARAATVGGWDPGYELTLTFELARFGGPARRPYVAAWVEDKDKFPVKTLALWFDNTRWLPEMRAWYHSDRVRAMAEGNDIVGTVSSATRPAGKYTLKWDGKDNAGSTVKAGKYTVCLEVSREHGGYQVYRQEMDLTGAPKSITLNPGAEVTAAALDYSKKAR